MPMVNEGLLHYLIEQSQGWDMLVPAMHPKRPEPLCALYRKSMTGIFGKMIEEKRYAVHQLIPMVSSLVLNIKPEMKFYHPDLFLNINRKDDLKRLPEDFGNEA